MKQPVPEKVTLKDPKQFRIIGQPTGRIDARDKSSGNQSYGIDMRLPGQLTAVVARPPVFGGKVKSLDDTAAKAVPGVKAVLRVPTDRGGDGVAVVATGYWAAKKGRDALKLEWDNTAVEKVDSAKQLASYQVLAKTKGLVHFDADVSKLAAAPKKISAEFVFPYLAHAPMEPLNCTVNLTGDKAELWLGTQMPGLDAAAAARVLGVPRAKRQGQHPDGRWWFWPPRHSLQRLRCGSLPGGQGGEGGWHHRPGAHAVEPRRRREGRLLSPNARAPRRNRVRCARQH